MEMISLAQELRENSYPGRGIILGRSEDGTSAVAAYFIMGRSENSRNRIFVEDGQGIRTQAIDSLCGKGDKPSPFEDISRFLYDRLIYLVFIYFFYLCLHKFYYIIIPIKKKLFYTPFTYL